MRADEIFVLLLVAVCVAAVVVASMHSRRRQKAAAEGSVQEAAPVVEPAPVTEVQAPSRKRRRRAK